MSLLQKSLSQLHKTTQINVRHYAGPGITLVGAIKDHSRGAYGKKAVSKGNDYFYNLQKEQLAKIKGILF